jgi:hypothetical protein
MTGFAEFGVRCVLDCSCPLSSAGGGDFFGASGVVGRERASGLARRAKCAKTYPCVGSWGQRDLVKTRRQRSVTWGRNGRLWGAMGGISFSGPPSVLSVVENPVEH